MYRLTRRALVPVILLAALAMSAVILPVIHAQDTPAPVTTQSFHDAMRKLWEEHITWTRNYIVSFTAGLPDVEALTNRLVQNQKDIGDAIRPYYGDDAGDQLTQLMLGHLTGAADLLTAAKAGDNDAVKAASDKWYANGDDIATFLNGINPDNWKLDDLKTMMKTHLDLTLAEATAHMGGDFEASIKGYDDVHTEILGMADMMSDGIIKQFPDKFAAAPAM